MKNGNGLIKRSFSLIMILLLVLPSMAGAISPSEGVMGADGNPLSYTSTLAGSAEFVDFRSPQGVLALSNGAVIVANSLNHRLQLIEGGQIKTYAGFEWLHTDENNQPLGGLLDGDQATAVFQQPKGLASDAQGNIYIADTMNHAVRKISSEGNVSTIAGDGVLGERDGTGAEARFYAPSDVAVAEDGTIYVADTLNHVIRKITADGVVSTLNTTSERAVEVSDGDVIEAGDYADGSLELAKFNEPSGIAIDSKGNLYVADAGNHLIRYIDLVNRTVSTVAGKANIHYEDQSLYAQGGFNDGAAAEAMFNFPKGLALTEEGGLVIADSMNHRVRYLFNEQVLTLAGSGSRGTLDGINGRNQLEFPSDVSVQDDGTIFIADTYNDRIRSVTFYQLPLSLTNKQINVVYETEVVNMDTKPEIVNGRTMIPIRAICEQLGYEVEYDADRKMIRLVKENVALHMTVDEILMEVEEGETKQVVTMDAAPYIQEDRVYVPLRVLSESLGYDVQWDQNTRTVIIR